MGLDLSIFYSLYGLSGHSAFVDGAIIFVGSYLVYVAMLAIVVLFIHALWKENLRMAMGYAVASLAGLISLLVTADVLEFLFPRPRPFTALHIPHLINEYSYSFPSGHTIFMFALATGVYRVNKTAGVALYCTGLLIGLARVAGGAHYPSDILGGIVFGVLTGFIVMEVWNWIAHRSGFLRFLKLA